MVPWLIVCLARARLSFCSAQRVQAKDWDGVAARAASHPDEASTWVSRREVDGTGRLRWRLLPLHAAVIFGAPDAALVALLTAYAAGAACPDDQGGECNGI